MSAAHDHAGIDCSIDGEPALCKTITAALGQIRKRDPRGFRRIRERVVSFRLLGPAETKGGVVRTIEQVERAPRMVEHPDLPGIEDPEVQLHQDDELCVPGVLALAPDAGLATVAHELGHAATTVKDMERRQAPDAEWAAELTADYYAYQWGFAQAIGRTRRWRRLSHHAVGPGQVIGLGDRWWRVSRRFVMHPCDAPDWARVGE